MSASIAAMAKDNPAAPAHTQKAIHQKRSQFT